jgi:hypothetical protein
MLHEKFDLDPGSEVDFISSLEDNNATNMIQSFVIKAQNPSADVNFLCDNLCNILMSAVNKTVHYSHFVRKRNISKSCSMAIVFSQKKN